MAKIFLVNSTDYVVADNIDIAVEKYYSDRGTYPTTIAIFKDTNFVITESVIAVITPAILPALAEADGATVSPSSAVYIKEGESITLTATPSAGYTTFVNWTISGSEVSTDNPFTYTATADDVTIVANFSA